LLDYYYAARLFFKSSIEDAFFSAAPIRLDAAATLAHHA
jgi:hypothetical protein